MLDGLKPDYILLLIKVKQTSYSSYDLLCWGTGQLYII